MRETRSTHPARLGGAADRARCLAEATRYLAHHDAEDAVQEALLRAWSKSDAWVPANGPLPWLLAITRNEALRIRGRTRPSPVEHVAETPENDPELDRLPQRLDVEQLVRDLPRRYGLLLQLYYLEDVSVEEIAHRLELPQGTVKRRLDRLRRRVRPTVEGWHA